MLSQKDSNLERFHQKSTHLKKIGICCLLPRTVTRDVKVVLKAFFLGYLINGMFCYLVLLFGWVCSVERFGYLPKANQKIRSAVGLGLAIWGYCPSLLHIFTPRRRVR